MHGILQQVSTYPVRPWSPVVCGVLSSWLVMVDVPFFCSSGPNLSALSLTVCAYIVSVHPVRTKNHIDWPTVTRMPAQSMTPCVHVRMKPTLIPESFAPSRQSLTGLDETGQPSCCCQHDSNGADALGATNRSAKTGATYRKTWAFWAYERKKSQWSFYHDCSRWPLRRPLLHRRFHQRAGRFVCVPPTDSIRSRRTICLVGQAAAAARRFNSLMMGSGIRIVSRLSVLLCSIVVILFRRVRSVDQSPADVRCGLPTSGT